MILEINVVLMISFKFYNLINNSDKNYLLRVHIR